MLKTAAYWLVFRQRTIRATLLDCLIIAGAPLLIGFIPVPLPAFAFFLASTALAIYLTMHYTGVGFMPDGLFIPLGVELAAQIVLWTIQETGFLA